MKIVTECMSLRLSYMNAQNVDGKLDEVLLIDENEYERVNGIYSNDRRSGKGDACVSAAGDQCC